MLSIPCGMATVTKEEQEENANSPMLVTDDGISIDAKDVQLLNIPLLMLSIPCGMVTDVKAEQPENAWLSIFVAVNGMLIDVKLEQL